MSEPFSDLEQQVPKEQILPLDDMRDLWNLADKKIPHVFDRPVLSMPFGEVSGIASDPGVGKTSLAIGLGVSIAMGATLVPGFTPARRGRVLFYLGEDGGIPVAQRTRAWCKLGGFTEEDYLRAYDDGYFSFCCGKSAPMLDFRLRTPEKTDAFYETMERCKVKQYDFIVVDSLGMYAGATDVNQYIEMQHSIMALRELAQASDAAVLFLHHLNKEGSKSGKASLNNMSGSAGIGGKIRWAAEMRKFQVSEFKQYGIDGNRGKNLVHFEVTKNQYGALPRPMVLERIEENVFNVATDLNRVDKNKDLLPAIVAELRAHPVVLSSREMYKGKSAASVDFRARVSERANNAATGWRPMQEAIEEGKKSGMLQEIPRPDEPNRTTVEVA